MTRFIFFVFGSLLIGTIATYGKTPDEPDGGKIIPGMTLIYDEPKCDVAIVDKLLGGSCRGTGTGVGSCVVHGHLVSYDVQLNYCRVWRSERRRPQFVRAFKKCNKNKFANPEFWACVQKNAGTDWK